MSESMHIYQYMLCNISASIGNEPEALLFGGGGLIPPVLRVSAGSIVPMEGYYNRVSGT